MLPAVENAIAQRNSAHLFSSIASAAAMLVLIALGIWYAFELNFIEKKGSKHQRRFNRTKHTIPWDKIKITDFTGEETKFHPSNKQAAAEAAVSAGSKESAKSKAGGGRKDKHV